jgi:hypothetical protein
MKIIAMVDRSAGNERVWDMWTETRIFDETDTLSDVYCWVENITHSMGKENIVSNVKLSIAK